MKINLLNKKNERVKNVDYLLQVEQKNKLKKVFLLKLFSNVFTFLILGISYGQSLKSFDGLFPNGKSQEGKATYKYYEDPETREFLKQGTFNYSFVGKGDYAGFNQTITGNFDKGLKDGTWTYKITMVDYQLGDYYHTGTITLISNYKNGLADGTWTEKYSDKVREKYFQYGQYYWGAFEPTQTFTAILNFKAGIIAGNVEINDVDFRAKGSYDEKGYTIGTWKIDLISKNQNLEITYKDNYMIDYTGRNAAGEILNGSTALYPKEAAEDFKRYLDVKAMTEEEREDAGFELELFCGNENVATKYINKYYEYMMSNDWFLYNYTKGDLTYNSHHYSIPGGCNVVVQRVTFDNMNQPNYYGYVNAEKAYNSGRFIDAAKEYFWFKENLKSAYSTSRFKKSELADLDKKILISLKKADSLSKIYMSEEEFIKYRLRFASDYDVSDKIQALEDFQRISKLLNVDFSSDYERFFSIIESQNISTYKVKRKNTNYYEPFLEVVWDCIDKYTDFWRSETIKCESQTYNSLEISTGKKNTGKDSTFYSCNEDELKTSLVNRGKAYVDTLNKVLKLVQDFESKANKIDALNQEKSTKFLYVTYLPFLDAFKKIYYESSELIEKIENLTSINSSLDKIIAHYAADPKAIDKLLKKAVTKEEQAEILFR